MIKYLSRKMADYVSENDDDADYEVLVYGFDLFVQEVLVVLAMLVIAIPFGIFFHTLASYTVYTLLRRNAGGAHASRRGVCMAVSAAMMYGPSLVFAKLSLRLHPAGVLALFALNLALLVLYAPADTEMRPVQSPEEIRKMKRASVATLVLYTALALFLLPWRPDFAGILSVVPTIVCVVLHPGAYKLFGCRKSTS